MRIAFNQNRDKVLFIHEDMHEYKRLHNFPAFLKEGPYFFVPAKSQVLFNVVNRLQRTKSKIRMDKDVHEFMNMPFKLLPIPGSFKFHTKPMDYQEIALRYIYTVGSGGLLLDPGMGKSKVVLDYIWLMQFKKVIIVCPKALLFVWEDEIAVHRPELSYHVVGSTDWEKELPGISGATVTILNYTKAVTLRAELAKVGYEFIHLDEFLIKDPKTDRTKSLTDLARRIPYKCGGSGTLINNTIMDVFCPVRYLEPALVGSNYKNFFDTHAVTVIPRAGGDGQQQQRAQVVAFKGKDIARSILESCSIVMTKDKWLKLPKKNFRDIYVQMQPEQREAYYSLMSNYITQVQGTFIEVDNPLVMMSKLYQISNGFVYHTPPEEVGEETYDLIGDDPKKKKKKSSRTTLFFSESAKIAALRKLLTETIKGRRAIIWFNMEAEYQMIEKMLKEENQTFLTIKGGEKATGEKVRRFNHDPSINWLVCQAKSVNYGITVLGTNLEKLEADDYPVFPGISPEVYTEVFFSMNFSLEVYLQQQDRIHRLGQKHECDYYRIFCNSPVEKRIRSAIEDKLTLRYDMLVDVAESLLKESKEDDGSVAEAE
jgi:SNF2 family DNA or RNA helicase